MSSESGDAKAKRYDRGIRIWGSHGQAALDNTRVCLLNASATGSETLKNLVLGGLASFTIVDGEKVRCLLFNPLKRTALTARAQPRLLRGNVCRPRYVNITLL